MKKNIFKSMIKSIVRAIWKVLFKPFVKLLPETKVKRNLIRAGGKIEQRNWWKEERKITFVAPPLPVFNVSDDLKNELNALSEIEPLLTPNQDFIDKLGHYSATPSAIVQPFEIGVAYGLILRYLDNLDFDVVFLAPWLKRGGADLGLLHHIHAQHEKGYRILLITTENVPSTWLFRLPENVKHLNLAEFTFGVKEEIQIELLARLLLQTKAQTIHNINSRLGWEVYKNYHAQFGVVNKKMFTSVFCEEKMPNGAWWGYAPVYLPNMDLTKLHVFCDTKWYPNLLINRFKMKSDSFSTIYFPYIEKSSDAYHAKENKPILWASRIAAQKRPELLYKIAKAMPEQQFHVYGECEPAFEEILNHLKLLPNVQYFSQYDNFVDLLKEKEYSLFLYTSEYDGLPNVLIEAIAVGLPVIAYDVGGISELIHQKALLSQQEDFGITIDKIKTLLEQPKLLHEIWQYSHEIVRNRHSWANFVEKLEKVDGYFPKLSRDEFMRLNSNMRILSKPND